MVVKWAFSCEELHNMVKHLRSRYIVALMLYLPHGQFGKRLYIILIQNYRDLDNIRFQGETTIPCIFGVILHTFQN